MARPSGSFSLRADWHLQRETNAHPKDHEAQPNCPLLQRTDDPATRNPLNAEPRATQVYFGQYFFVMGIKYTDALSGSIWQNTIPIFTLFMGLLSGLEKIDMRPHGMAKLVGA